jgi:outer membrane protein assembly factor BamB
VLLLAGACANVASPKGWSAPQDGDSVVVVAHKDKLYTVDSADDLFGRLLFPPEPNVEDIDTEALYGDTAVVGDRIFVPTYDNRLYAIDFDGLQVWPGPFEAGGQLIGGVIFVPEEDGVEGDGVDGELPAGTVYFGSEDGKLYALEADRGIQEWFFETDDGIWSTPAFFEGLLYVTSLDGNLYVLDADTGALQWKFETDAGIAATPVIDEAERLVIVGGFDSKLRAINIDTQQERWSFGADNWFWTTPLVADGIVYAGSLDGNVYAVDIATGRSAWAQPFETEQLVRSAPALAGGVLVVADGDGNVFGIDPETGVDVFIGSIPLPDKVLADPLVRVGLGDDGEAPAEIVLIVTTGGELYEIDPQSPRNIDLPVQLGD